MIDRFRSLPMNQSSVLVGRTVTDLFRALLAVAIMWIVGLLIGFSPTDSVSANVAAVLIMLLFGFALSWIGVAAGSLVRTPEALQGVIFAVVFPLTFVSSAFVPVATMPDPLRWFAERNPLSLVINTVRSLTIEGVPGPDFVGAILWSIGLLVAFFPIGLWLYNRRTTQ
jgi:ABC-2 type transport system permease protein/oleandomycin transport system permease protein